MDINPLRLLESLHGHAGIVAVALLLHPAVSMWRGVPLSRGARWATALALAAISIAFTSGLVVYQPYRAQVKRSLFTRSPAAGWLFETKEHLAYVALALAFGATILALTARPVSPAPRRAAARMYAAAAIAAFASAAIGTWVSAIAGF
jgi:hypothetical protein